MMLLIPPNLAGGEPPAASAAGATPPPITPRIVPEDGYIGSDDCRDCHREQHATWHASYHRTMTQVADSRSIRAPFDGTELSLEGADWRVEKRGEEFWVRGRPGASGGTQPATDRERRVVMATGSHNYQLYWLEEQEAGAGMGQFPLIYLLREGLWAPRKSRFLGPSLETTPNETGRWGRHCIKCHATHGQPAHVPSGETRVAELGISCEACHGPGADHARMQHSRQAEPLLAGRDIVNPRNLGHQRSTEVCGQCHSIEIFLDRERAMDWIRAGSRFRPGEILSDYQSTVRGRYEDNPPAVRQYLNQHQYFSLENCFWPDGVVRVSGREYHGTVESPCFQRGEMSCISCHRMHRPDADTRPLKTWANDQLGPGLDGNQACLQCHTGFSDSGALTAHTRHPAGSSGSECYNCHMPYTSWGLLRAIRSHTIESPDVATTVATGRPNACNQCHLDRTLAWSAQHLDEWYGAESPALTEEQKTVAASVLWAVKGDPVQLALMAWSMGWEPARELSGSQWLVFYLGGLLADPYDAVRFRAQRSLQKYPEYAAVTKESVTVSTKAEQQQIQREILAEWIQSFPRAPDRRGAELLIHADGSIDQAAYQKLSAERDDRTRLTLFE